MQNQYTVYMNSDFQQQVTAQIETAVSKGIMPMPSIYIGSESPHYGDLIISIPSGLETQLDQAIYDAGVRCAHLVASDDTQYWGAKTITVAGEIWTIICILADEPTYLCSIVPSFLAVPMAFCTKKYLGAEGDDDEVIIEGENAYDVIQQGFWESSEPYYTGTSSLRAPHRKAYYLAFDEDGDPVEFNEQLEEIREAFSTGAIQAEEIAVLNGFVAE